MLMLMSLMIILNSIFISLSHPLSMGLMIILQTLMIAIFSGLVMNSFWFSYILILVFLGGLLIIFIYVSTLASNEQMSVSFPMTATIFLVAFLFLMLSFNPSKIFLFNDNMSSMSVITWMYSQPFMLISSFLIIYLFIVLIAIVKITKYWVGALRPL